MKTILRNSAVTIVAAVAMTTAAMADQINYNVWLPPSEIVVRDGFIPYFDKVTEETGGKAQVQLFTAGQMMGPRDTMPGIRDGAIQGGFVGAGYHRSELPYSAIFNDLIAQSQDPIAASGASFQTFFQDCPECMAEQKANNLKPLGGQSSAPYTIMCAPEITSAEDLKGLRIRGSNDFHFAAINALGGNGVNVPFSEISQAFERGNVDCFLGGPTWIRAFGLLEIIKSRVESPTIGVLSSPGMLTFQLSAWESWAPETRASLIKNASTFVADTTLSTIADNKISEDLAIAEGMKNLVLGDDMVQIIADFRVTERARLIDTAVKNGADSATVERIIDTYAVNYDAWLARSADIGTDKAKFIAALDEHIYSKFDMN